MSPALQRLRALLEALLRVDQADLDFGIHRIARLRRAELCGLVDRLAGHVDDLLAGAPGDPAARADEVFGELARFLRRYYQGGDFVAQPRYRDDVYALPYGGEELKFHWASRDLLYVKSSERLASYAFRLADGRRVRFTVVAAALARDNNLARRARCFLAADEPVRVCGDELLVRFERRAATDREAGGAARLRSALAQALLDAPAAAGFREALAAPAPTARDPERTCLERHLAAFTAPRSFDYFIHRDLAGFLGRELDAFVGRELLDVDVLTGGGEEARAALSRARAVRVVGRRIITALGQLEDLQRDLWLRPKRVLESAWFISLDRIPAALYPELAACAAQREAWVKTLRIDRLPGYGAPLDASFLERNPALIVDTARLPEELAARVLEAVDFAGGPTGALVHGDALQAARVLAASLSGQVKAAYLDPPYNTSEETFLYKNQFRHASWLSMMADRVAAVDACLADDGALLVTIDDAELHHLKLMLDELLGARRHIGTVVIESNPRGRGINRHYATCHEYMLVYAKEPERARIVDRPLTRAQAREYRHGAGEGAFRLLPFRRSGGLSTPGERPNSEYALYCDDDGRLVAVGGARTAPPPAPYEAREVLWLEGEELASAPLREAGERLAGLRRVLPIDAEGRRRIWRWADRKKVLAAAARGEFVIKLSEGAPVVLLRDPIKGGRKPKTVWQGARYDASAHGTNLLQAMFGARATFGYPKSLHAVRDALQGVVGEDREALVVDLFGGSGTTAHAVLELNREDGGARRFALAEMGEYFDDVTCARVIKAAYSKTWRNGQPLRDAPASVLIQRLRLERYEDMLDALTLAAPEGAASLLAESPALADAYVGARMFGAQARAALRPRLDDPFGERARVRHGGGATEATVDWVETFNLLLGLRVRHRGARFHRAATFDLERSAAALSPCPSGHGWSFQVVAGETPAGARALILWRSHRGDPARDCLALAAVYAGLPAGLRRGVDVLWTNGDCDLASRRGPEDSWELRRIEDELERLLRPGEAPT